MTYTDNSSSLSALISIAPESYFEKKIFSLCILGGVTPRLFFVFLRCKVGWIVVVMTQMWYLRKEGYFGKVGFEKCALLGV